MWSRKLVNVVLVICASWKEFCLKIWDDTQGECEISKSQSLAWVGDTQYRWINRPQGLLAYRGAKIEEWGPRPPGHDWDDAIRFAKQP